MKMPSDTTRTARYAILAVGSILIIAALVSATRSALFLTGASRTTGIVIDLEKRLSSDLNDLEERRAIENGDYMYFPVVRFETASGKLIQFTSTEGSSPPGYHLGEQVVVSYRPDNPQNARINSFLTNWFSSLVLTVLGSIVFWLGI